MSWSDKKCVAQPEKCLAATDAVTFAFAAGLRMLMPSVFTCASASVNTEGALVVHVFVFVFVCVCVGVCRVCRVHSWR